MFSRAALATFLALGLTSLATAQPGADDDFGAFSDDNGAPAGRAQEQRGQQRGQDDQRQVEQDRGRRNRGNGGFRQFRGPRPNPMFEAIDTDGDNVISAKELRKAVAALKRLDADEDGNITLEEASPRGGPGGPGGFADRIMENDANKDGKLTPDEVPEPLARMLTGADLNADGAIDREELDKAMQTFRDRFGRGGPGGGFGGRGGFGAMDPDAMTKQFMAGDRNGDGVLSPNEVPPPALGMLRNADTNRDGVLDAREVRQAMETAQARFQRFRGGQGDRQDFNGQDRGRRRQE